MKVEVGYIKKFPIFTSKFSPIAFSYLWDEKLTSRQGNIENKGFLVLRVRKFKKMAFFDT